LAYQIKVDEIGETYDARVRNKKWVLNFSCKTKGKNICKEYV